MLGEQCGEVLIVLILSTIDLLLCDCRCVKVLICQLGLRHHLTVWVQCEDRNETRDVSAAMRTQRRTRRFYPSFYKPLLHHTLFCLPLSPFLGHPLVCLSLSVSFSCRIGGPRDIDRARLNAVRLMGDVWFTDEILALVHSALQPHTNQHAGRTYTHWHTRTQAKMHVHTIKPHTHTHTHTRTHSHTNLYPGTV